MERTGSTEGHRWRYYLGLAVGVVAISFTAILIRLAEAPALTIATVRMAITILLLLPVLAAFGGGSRRAHPA
jgi:hypothetical protein